MKIYIVMIPTTVIIVSMTDGLVIALDNYEFRGKDFESVCIFTYLMF